MTREETKMHSTQSSVRIIICVLFVLLSLSVAHGQFRAGIAGTVKDANGALVPDATITLTSVETNKGLVTTSNSDGAFRFTGLAPGHYQLTAEKTGFHKAVYQNVTVSAEGEQGLDVVLTTGE